MQEILSPDAAQLGLDHITDQILARVESPEELALVGIRRGGVPLSLAIAERIERKTGYKAPLGSVDITLYRDDAPTALPNPRIGRSDVPFLVSSKRIVLVDDVLYTGRTVRAALHALLDYGRSKSILLAVLVDRGGRELPIEASFVGHRQEVSAGSRVEVIEKDGTFRAILEEST